MVAGLCQFSSKRRPSKCEKTKTKVNGKDKRPQAKCPPTCEMSVFGEYVYNMYVKNYIKGMANSLPSPDQTKHGPF